MAFAFPLIGLLVFFKGRIFVRFWRQIGISRRMASVAVPFERRRPESSPKILIAGDSTALGTGALDPWDSIAGRFARDFPSSHIVNLGRNGLRTPQLTAQLAAVTESFDITVILIGANDVIRRTHPQALRESLDQALQRAKRISQHVIVIFQGNIGNAPIFPPVLYQQYTRKARHVRDVFIEAAGRQSVAFVDLFVERGTDHWRREPQKYFADDHFHPSGEGYREWYEKIRQVMQEKGIALA